MEMRRGLWPMRTEEQHGRGTGAGLVHAAEGWAEAKGVLKERDGD